jgi:enamine deaminase RidA (YjgF/YER057c/UK114 family)
VNPESLAPPVGFSHVVVTAPGRLVFLAGQTAHNAEGALCGETLLDQFDVALKNVGEALAAVGGGPQHLVSLQILVTDVEAYRHSLSKVGEIYRRHFGRHFPAMALVEVSALFDRQAQVEVLGVAVVPH